MRRCDPLLLEFLRRCLQHVPPTGFHRIRYYGLWSPAARGRLRRAMLLLATVRAALAAMLSAAAESAQARHQAVATCRCPNCQSRNVHILAFFRPGEHGPP